MATWKKVIVSGSSADLTQITASTALISTVVSVEVPGTVSPESTAALPDTITFFQVAILYLQNYYIITQL